MSNVVNWQEDMAGIKKLTAGSWDAYYDQKGIGTALRRVNSSLYNAIKWARKKIESDPFVSEVKVGQECFRRVYEVAGNVGRYGFTDTECRRQLTYFIEKWLDLPYDSVEPW